MSKLILEGPVGVDWVEMERGVVGREKTVQSQRDMKNYIWEVVNNCVWLECEVRASHSVLLKEVWSRCWGRVWRGRSKQSMMAL